MSHDRIRSRTRALLALGSVAAVVAVAVPGSSSADPTPSIDEVRQQVDTLNQDAEQASERSNGVREHMKTVRVRVDKLAADIDHQQAQVDDLRSHIAAIAAAKYRSGGFDTTVQLLLAKDPDQFIDQMTSAQALAGQQADSLVHLQAEEKLLTEQKQARRAELARYREARAKAVRQHATAVAKAKKAQALLDRLTEEQRRRMLALQQAQEREQQQRQQNDGRSSRDGGRSQPAPDPPAPLPAPSGRGAQAVAFARAQLGEPYVFGAAGPSSWDCSGLTMMAWQSAGVSLPHGSSQQYYAVSTKVSMSQLQPGDLVMYYSTMHHVAIYVGGGMVIHAPHPGASVEYAPVGSMPFAGAVRPG